MIPRPPRSTRTDTHFPYTTRFRSEDDNGTLEMACDVSMHAGWLIPLIQKALGMFVSDQVRRAPSWDIYPSARNVRFNEMEYAVAADQGLAVMDELLPSSRKSARKRVVWGQSVSVLLDPGGRRN